MELAMLRVSFVVGIFVAVTMCCLLPIVLFRRACSHDATFFWHRLLNWCDCLTGGVFLSMCFLGLLPNVQEQSSQLLAGLHLSTAFPMAECAVLLGFFVVLAFDQMSRLCTDAARRQPRVARRRIIEMDALGNGGGGGGRVGTDDDRRTLLISNGGGGGGIAHSNRSVIREDDDDDDDDLQLEGHGATASTGLVECDAHSSTRKQLVGGEDIITTDNQCHRHALDMVTGAAGTSGYRFLVLLFALSTHALFEGIVLGLQRDVPRAVHLFAAIALHEAVVAATLGFHIARANLSLCAAVRYTLLFGVCIPVGIGVGMVIGETPGLLGYAVSGSLQAVAAGIFLHITFMQLLPQQFGHGADGLVKTLFLFVGFLLLTILTLTLRVDD